ncbi:MAG: ComF family protein [Prolixibacteraceae bacterium]|jgi:ComF family protein|nr:ComF family protein [Prolixibacteraceae bacterium]
MKKFLSAVQEYLYDFSTLIYPNLCICCDESLVKQENMICTRCAIGLPRTYFHLADDNPVSQLFWGRVKLEKATSFYFFQKGSKYQKLLHHLKYKGDREIGVVLGRMLSADLNEVNFQDDIDYIVPVPLHPRKKRQRGYNQSEAIAEGMGAILNTDVVANNLQRKFYSTTQTRKGRFERWENVNNLFAQMNPEQFANKHILLVDDVITTGSTLEACAHAVLESENSKVSIATLAFAVI